MVKVVKTVDTDIQTTEQLVEQIGSELSFAWHALDGDKKAQAALGIAFDKVKQLQHVNTELDALLRGSQAAVIEMGRQRDIAIHDAATWRKHGDELARRIIAGHIAVDADIPVTDVIRVLSVLSGDKCTFEEPALEELYSAIQELANRLFEEQIYDTANHEE